MSSFDVSKAARADLKNIAAYTQKTWGACQRRKYLKDLDKAFHFLSDNPLSGNQCDYITKELRKHPHESHTVFYEISKNSIFIVRLLHKSMDVDSNFENP
jgi:toxin ParE1/3/4